MEPSTPLPADPADRAAPPSRARPGAAGDTASSCARLWALRPLRYSLLGVLGAAAVGVVAAMSLHPPLPAATREHQLHVSAQAAERAAHALGATILARIPARCADTSSWCTSGAQSFRELRCGSELGFYEPVKLDTQYLIGLFGQGAVGAPVDSRLTHLGEVLHGVASKDLYDGSGVTRFHAATVTQRIEGTDVITEVVHFSDGKVAIKARTGCG